MLIETLTFRLRPDVSEEEFLSADRRVQTELVPTHQGFLRRTTARGEHGGWIVVTLWAGPADADTSASRSVDHPAVAAFMAAVEPTSVVTQRFTTLD